MRRAACARHVGVIAAKDQRSLFQLRVRAVGAGGVGTSLNGINLDVFDYSKT